MFDGRWRQELEKGLKPVGQTLRRIGVRADHLTILGMTMAVGAAFAIANGELKLGFLLLVLAGVPDALDGAVAKASGTSSNRGAYFDSVADRVSDALLFGGLAWYLSSTEPGSQIVILPVAILGSASIVSYQRAKADALGFDARGGLMERAERFVVLGIGLLFDSILIPVLWLMLAATFGTAVFRFVKVWRQAPVPTAAPRPRATRRNQRPRPSTERRTEAKARAEQRRERREQRRSS